MIVADSPTLKIGLKRKDLVLGNQYVIKQPVRFQGGFTSQTYRRVHLVDLVAGNKAVVQYDELRHDKPIGQKDRKVVKKVVMLTVSCSQFLATVEDWDAFPRVWNAKTKRLELDFTKIEGEQAALADPAPDNAPNGFRCNRLGVGHWFGSFYCPKCRS